MTTHKVGTREEWKAALEAVHGRAQELGKLDEEIAKQRQDPRHHSDCDLARADRKAEGLQAAAGLEVPLRVVVRE
jgi:hypothetical protein